MRPTAVYFKEGIHARIATRGNASPPVATANRQIVLSHLWAALPDKVRQQTLKTLSRIVTQQLLPPPDEKEVDHEDC